MDKLVIGSVALVLYLATRKDQTKPTNPNINKIDDGLYLTCDTNAREYKTLGLELGVKQILTIGKELRPHSKSTPFTMMRIDLDDHPAENISKYFYSAHEFIEKAPTVVHCAMGISRSATLVIAHLMIKYKITLDEALKRVRTARWQVNPNPGFIDQLKQLEKQLGVK
jgi:atypical dual specificity phosphatase